MNSDKAQQLLEQCLLRAQVAGLPSIESFVHLVRARNALKGEEDVGTSSQSKEEAMKGAKLLWKELRTSLGVMISGVEKADFSKTLMLRAQAWEVFGHASLSRSYLTSVLVSPQASEVKDVYQSVVKLATMHGERGDGLVLSSSREDKVISDGGRRIKDNHIEEALDYLKNHTKTHHIKDRPVAVGELELAILQSVDNQDYTAALLLCQDLVLFAPSRVLESLKVKLAMGNYSEVASQCYARLQTRLDVSDTVQTHLLLSESFLLARVPSLAIPHALLCLHLCGSHFVSFATQASLLLCRAYLLQNEFNRVLHLIPDVLGELIPNAASTAQAQAWLVFAKAHMGLAQWDRALVALQRGAAVCSHEKVLVEVLFLQAHVCSRLGREDQCEEVSRQFLALTT